MKLEDLQVLPTRLTRPVLTDAIFHIRLRGKAGIADLLPGGLAAGLREVGEPAVTRLAAADIPQQFRMTQPELMFAPLVQLRWPEFMINIGDRSLAILCTLPYVGWTRFKQNILSVVGVVGSMGFIESVDQFGFRYIDFLDDQLFAADLKRVDWDFQLGGRQLEAARTALKTRWEEGASTLSVEIAATLSMTINGEQKGSGIYMATEAMKELAAPIDWQGFATSLGTEIDSMHTQAKRIFFQCLTKEALAALGPVYEEGHHA